MLSFHRIINYYFLYKKIYFMAIKTSSIHVKTTGSTDICDITGEIAGIVEEFSPKNGFITLFISGSTAALTTLEYESGAVSDLKRAIERIAPKNLEYEHDNRWGDGNGYAHVRAALLGPSLTIPLVDSQMRLGTWQQIILCDFDNRPRTREILVQMYYSD